MYVYQYIYFLELANTNTVAAPTKVASPKLIAELLAANFLSFSSNIANFDSSVRKTSPMDEDEVEGGGVGCENPSRGVVQVNGDDCCCCCCWCCCCC